jgi:hypothetical protein
VDLPTAKQVCFRYSFDDILDLQSLIPDARIKRWIAFAISGFLFLMAGEMVLTKPRGIDPDIVWYFGGTVLLLALLACRFSAVVAWLTDTPKGEFTVAVDGQQFEFLYEGSPLTFEWNSKCRIYESKSTILICFGKGKGFLSIPKRFFSHEEINQLCDLLRRRIDEHKAVAKR